ncbi:alpha carbonic anhydrase 1, chloroplastic [Prosopis cineraria]|uniref:alpha carbonic anhydrase 1, chloroplastic-like n=1 Tax=Prosopis cineraria TaxID=364024 RepID=UPI00240EAFF3|nr:alpha carbonic anhydrase 1, chloroplastic-like [Prosopis cineraria]XP_054803687.1 alpha carbonic anhydrase 1, chloroplastic [Prosopis cineraria]
MSMTIFFLILSCALLALCTSADPVNFGYYGANGPNKWGSLSPSFSACSKGKAQSPVDLRNENIVYNKQLKPLERHYHSANASLVNNGFNIGIHFDMKVGDLRIDGQKFYLKQMHWHSPSEHRVNGKKMDAELHLVHQNEEGSFAVVGVLYKLGDSDPVISKLEKKLVELAKESSAGYDGAHIDLGTFDVRHMKRRSRTYYRYVGSLTTPPCKENVTWSILGKVRSISTEQIHLLKAPLSPQFKNNARPVQPLDGRKIHKYSAQG